MLGERPERAPLILGKKGFEQGLYVPIRLLGEPRARRLLNVWGGGLCLQDIGCCDFDKTNGIQFDFGDWGGGKYGREMVCIRHGLFYLIESRLGVGRDLQSSRNLGVEMVQTKRGRCSNVTRRNFEGCCNLVQQSKRKTSLPLL